MDEFLAACLAAVPGVVVSALISGLLLYYIRAYIDNKLREDEEHRKKEQQLRLQRSQLEKKRCRAEGRLLFWLHRAIVSPPHNGELDKAMEDYQAVEDEQKALDQKILAEFELGGSA